MKRGEMYIDPDDVLTPIRKNNRGISGVDHNMTAVTDILIFGLQLYWRCVANTRCEGAIDAL